MWCARGLKFQVFVMTNPRNGETMDDTVSTHVLIFLKIDTDQASHFFSGFER